MTKIDYTEQALGLDRPSPADDLLRVSGASPEQCQGSDHSCISNQTRACFSELFTVFYTIKKKKKKPPNAQISKDLLKVVRKVLLFLMFFTMVVTYLIVQYFLENCLTSSTTPLPFLFCSPYLLSRLTGVYYLCFESTLTCINIWHV